MNLLQLLRDLSLDFPEDASQYVRSVGKGSEFVRLLAPVSELAKLRAWDAPRVRSIDSLLSPSASRRHDSDDVDRVMMRIA
jgi:hypothetical protein